ncbi:hypothetical protein JRK18_003821 [Salmonella enterica]|uniref:LuxR C-terminal-related transcriptional regulator n=2 Tax=Salmonella enterica TaxID=28901 RepID=UPI000503ABD7|nr:hypothetical protein [Salmonella enterica subsp. enterica serovar Bareilly]EAB7562373.1 hypothetical protein [Salmonella enterica subsp. enterica serovar Newport]EAX6576955.1 hypothetical protein [Salmonella enterica]ECB3799847.1 hypothetical protein [Salmonella enterica subsp. enterica serovar Typhimurium]KFT73331.1 hypothetical protein SEEB0208_22240 [Salmonella enterica subsp. enterica serovar Bareilly str. CFSAN000208]KFU05382.1 hypothetical protein SEEB0201_06830 [Salmonella enterica s
MHRLFVVTDCQFTLMGLEWLMKEADKAIKVIQVRKPEDVLTSPEGEGNRAVLIVMPVGSPAIRASGRLFLWRWALWRPVSQTGITPCLLLCDKQESNVTGAYPLSRQLSLPTLSAQLLAILNYPAFYVRTCSRVRPLTAIQRVVLEATITGERVSVTAARLGVTERSVFSCRTALIHKIGLRNRMELMCLNDRDAI